MWKQVDTLPGQSQQGHSGLHPCQQDSWCGAGLLTLLAAPGGAQSKLPCDLDALKVRSLWLHCQDPITLEAAHVSGIIRFFPLFKKKKKKHFGVWCTSIPSMALGRTQAPDRKTGVVKGHASGSKGAESFSTSGQGSGTTVGRWASWHMGLVCSITPPGSQVCRLHPLLQGLGGVIQGDWTGS